VGTLAVTFRDRTKILDGPKKFAGAAAWEVGMLVERKKSANLATDA
jgi:hypothetical protein